MSCSIRFRGIGSDEVCLRDKRAVLFVKNLKREALIEYLKTNPSWLKLKDEENIELEQVIEQQKAKFATYITTNVFVRIY